MAGFLTHRLLRGDPRKIVLVHSSIALELGSHRSPGNRPLNDPLVAVHHFKWRHGITADLRRRVIHHSDGSWSETTPAVRTEAGRPSALPPRRPRRADRHHRSELGLLPGHARGPAGLVTRQPPAGSLPSSGYLSPGRHVGEVARLDRGGSSPLPVAVAAYLATLSGAEQHQTRRAYRSTLRALIAEFAPADPRTGKPVPFAVEAFDAEENVDHLTDWFGQQWNDRVLSVIRRGDGGRVSVV